ncbi:MAG: CBS domain-containing protein [Bdellovibrio sp.]
MKAKDFMTKDVITCKLNDKVRDAALIMTKKRISIIPVVNDQNCLQGIITISDFIGRQINIPHALVSIKRLLGQNFYRIDIHDIFKKAQDYTLDQVMTRKLAVVHPDTSLNGVVNTMIEKGHKRLPVVEKGKLVGIITRKDIARAFTLIQ